MPVVCAPLRFQDDVLGAVFLAEKIQKADFTAADEKLLFALATQAANSIENARLLENVKKQRDEIAAMKNGVIIINTARGSLINEDALCDALTSEKVQCACLDVYDEEPYKGKLVRYDNVILTPHIGSYAREARITMERQAVENVIKGLKEST